MKNWIVGCMIALGVATGSMAAKSPFPIDEAPDLTNDMAAMQRGAALFVNYCMTCHSASFERFKRFKELGLTERQIRDNLMFTSERVGDLMIAAVDAEGAKLFWGKVPPDLTLLPISRTTKAYSGADYIYTLMRSYYRDDTTVHGWNNTVFSNIAMPNPLWELQGERRPIIEQVVQADGTTTPVLRGWEQVTPGTMTPEEYDRAIAELVSFMTWLSEPNRDERKQLGIFVLAFLAVFTFVAWRLNAAYWKDIK